MKKILFLIVTFFVVMATPLIAYADTRIINESWSDETYYKTGLPDDVVTGGDRAIVGVTLTKVNSKETVTVKVYCSGDRADSPIYTFKLKNPTKNITYSSGYFNIPGDDEEALVIVIESKNECSGSVRAYRE